MFYTLRININLGGLPESSEILRNHTPFDWHFCILVQEGRRDFFDTAACLRWLYLYWNFTAALYNTLMWAYFSMRLWKTNFFTNYHRRMGLLELSQKRKNCKVVCGLHNNLNIKVIIAVIFNQKSLYNLPGWKLKCFNFSTTKNQKKTGCQNTLSHIKDLIVSMQPPVFKKS